MAIRNGDINIGRHFRRLEIHAQREPRKAASLLITGKTPTRHSIACSVLRRGISLSPDRQILLTRDIHMTRKDSLTSYSPQQVVPFPC